jgi:long-chain acyl-CoA synthetase
VNTTDQILNDSDDMAVYHARGAQPVERTYRQIADAIRRLTGAFANLGIGTQSRVVLICSTSIEMLESIVASIRLGASTVPLSPLMGAANLLSIIEAVRPTCCVFDDPIPEEVLPALKQSCGTFISLRTARAATHHTYEDLLKSPAQPARADVPEDHEALIIFSSGSEGAPKGIRHSHRELDTFLRLNALMHAQYGTDEETVYLRSAFISVIPLNHLAGLGMCLNGLMHGRPTYLMSHFVPGRYLQLVEQSRSEVLMLVPSMYRALLGDRRMATTDLSAVRYCIAMGEPCTPELSGRISRAFGAPVATAYGMTECFTGIGHRRDDLRCGVLPPASCGRHFFGEVKLVDENGVENERFGELWVRNESVRPCYTDGKRNAERFHDGWYASRDLFERSPDGHFFHRGRCDDMFICCGKNIHPVEIEAVLGRHPDIAQVCAAPIRLRDENTMPGVLVIAKQALSESEVIDFAARNGPGHAVPRVVSFVEQLPLVGPGKVNRREARQMLQQAYDRAAG